VDVPALSVVICTHNPRTDYFGRTLEALRGQSLSWAQWELVVVDNRSDQPVAQRFDFSWHPAARIVREEKLGLTPARLRGIREAVGELLIFVDDDNVLDADYLETALRIAQQRPYLGSWSGQCRPGFEEQPAEWTRRYWGNLAIREFAEDKWSNLPRLPETMPCGAGLCVRRAVARHYLEENLSGRRLVQLDRTGASLLSGGDNDLAACACDIGLGVGLVSSLKLTHLIPPVRLTEDYLSRLAEGIYYSAVVLAYVRSEVTELESYKVRWHELFRVLLQRAPHRAIQLSVLRGRKRGLEYVRGLSGATGRRDA
jgi:glycosyltransferase involved in cell wall biosynthesis